MLSTRTFRTRDAGKCLLFSAAEPLPATESTDGDDGDRLTHGIVSFVRPLWLHRGLRGERRVSDIVRKLLFSTVLLLGGLGTSSACTRTPPAPTKITPTALELEVSGCAVVGARTCELAPDAKLRVFTREPVLEARTQTGADIATTSRDVEGGHLVTLTAPPEATEIRLSAPNESSTRYTIDLVRPHALPWLDEAKAMKQSGALDDAFSRASAGETSTVPRERALALGMMARIELARGKIDRAALLLRSAMQADRAAGRVSDLVDDAFALAYALQQRSHRYDEARAVLDDVTLMLPSYADGRARDPYYRGILAAETGDLRGALRNLREAELRASRLGLDRLVRNARSAYLLALLRLGRATEANESLRSLENELVTTEGVTACERVEVAINVGWAALVANESGAREDASGPLERAIAEPACGDPYLRGIALGDLALAYLRRGDTTRATSHLAEARRTVTEPSGAEQLFWLDVEARIALATWDARRALTLFDRACRLARASLLREAEYTCTLGRAEALEVQGKLADATTAYRAAEDILDERSVLVPLGEGRSSFVGQRGASARLGVDLLVRTNHVPEALAMARTSRSRVLADVERATRLEQLAPPERVKWEQAIGAYRRARAEIDAEAAADWRLPQDKLATLATTRKSRDAELATSLEQAMSVIPTRGSGARPMEREPGTLVLVLHPVRAGWLAIVADDSGVTSFPLGEVNVAADAAVLATQVLGPIAPRLARAKLLRVLAFGSLRAIDVHALPFHGEPLLARLAVEYPLDLRDALAPPAVAPSSLIVGVVGDPSGDLPAAREEARSVAITIGKTGAHVLLLEGERATSAAVFDLLARADGLHYAGHGVYAGQEGWESLLPLAAGGRLTIGDVLALHQALRRVVLSGCETARASHDASAEGLGLAQAFVIVGSNEVVAPVRPVRDVLAAAVSRAFYEAIPSSTNAAEALAYAQNVVRRDMPAEDWSSFRLLSP